MSQSNNQSNNQPVDSVPLTASGPVKRPFTQKTSPVTQSAKTQSNKQTDNESTTKTKPQSNNQSNNQSINQSNNQSNKQSNNQSNNQTVKQSNNQPVNRNLVAQRLKISDGQLAFYRMIFSVLLLMMALGSVKLVMWAVGLK